MYTLCFHLGNLVYNIIVQLLQLFSFVLFYAFCVPIILFIVGIHCISI